MKEKILLHNYFNLIPLRDLTSLELNIFFYLIKSCNNRGTNEISLTYKEIQNKLNLQNYQKNKLTYLFNSVLTKVMDIKIFQTLVDNEGYKEHLGYNLFSKFQILEKEKLINVVVSNEALFLLNNFTKNFLKFDYFVYLGFENKYTKELYRRLRQFDRTKLWRVSLKDFALQLDIPRSYLFPNIKERIIEPSINDLLVIYPNLKVNYIYEKNTGKKGRPKVKTLEFIWKDTYLLINGQKVDAETGEIIHKRKQIKEEQPIPELKDLSDEERLLIQQLRELKAAEEEDNKSKNKKVNWSNEEVYSILNKKFQKE